MSAPTPAAAPPAPTAGGCSHADADADADAATVGAEGPVAVTGPAAWTRALYAALPLPTDLQRLVGALAAEEPPLPLLERALVRSLTATATGTSAASSHGHHPPDADADARASRNHNKQNRSHADKLQRLLLSHSSFPRHRCARMLLLLDAEEGAEEELPAAVADGAALTPPMLSNKQRKQWDRLVRSHLRAEGGEGEGGDGDGAEARPVAHLVAVRLEAQEHEIVNLQPSAQQHIQRLIVSQVRFQPDAASSAAGSGASGSADPFTSSASPAHSDEDSAFGACLGADEAVDLDQLYPSYLNTAHCDPFDRAALFPPPTAQTLLADMWPRHADQKPIGEETEWVYAPAAPDCKPVCYLLQASRALRRGTWKIDTQWNHGAAERQSYVVRQCVGVWWWIPDAGRHVATGGGGGDDCGGGASPPLADSDLVGTIASAAYHLQYAERLAALVESGMFFSAWWAWYPPAGQPSAPPPSRSHQWLTLAVREEVQQARRRLADRQRQAELASQA